MVKKPPSMLLRVRVVGTEEAIAPLAKLTTAAGVVLGIVETIENRCMAADGSVTPTLREMTEEELRRLWRACKTIASTQLPQLVTGKPLDEIPMNPAQRERIDARARGKLRMTVIPAARFDPTLEPRRRRKARRKST